MSDADIAPAEIDNDETSTSETDPNFSVQKVSSGRGGADLDAWKVAFGTPPRNIVVRDLDLAAQFDLVEMAGDRTSNPTWMAMAGLAWGTVEIDGVPSPPSRTIPTIRNTLNRIKPEGLTAYFKAMRKTQMLAEETVATAKN